MTTTEDVELVSNEPTPPPVVRRRLTRDDLRHLSWTLNSYGGVPSEYRDPDAGIIQHTMTVTAPSKDDDDDGVDIVARLHFESAEFRLTDATGSERFQAFDCESQDMAILYHLTHNTDGELDDENVFGGIWADRLLLFNNEHDLQPELRYTLLHHISELFSPCIVVVGARTAEERDAWLGMGFTDLMPKSLQAIELMPPNDIDHMETVFQAMRDDPLQRWLWNSSDLKWPKPKRKRRQHG